jgi:hypothetical protein
MAGIVPLTACGVKRKGYKILWRGCGRIDDQGIPVTDFG